MMNRNKRASILLVAAITLLLCLAGTPAYSKPKIDKEVTNGLTLLQAGDYPAALEAFNKAFKIHKRKDQPSKVLVNLLDYSTPRFSSDDPVLADALKKGADGYYPVQATKQVLLQFRCYLAALTEKDKLAEELLDEVRRLQGPMWGSSWRELIPKTHRLFIGNADIGETTPWCTLQKHAGILLNAIQDKSAEDALLKAHQGLSNDPSVSFELASFYIANLDADKAIQYGTESLALDAGQPMLQIHLATAHWLKDELDQAEECAQRAIRLDPELPGSYAALAFVGLERGNVKEAITHAERGYSLSNKHTFYGTILACCQLADGDKQAAKRIITYYWGSGPASLEEVGKWFFRGEVLRLYKELANAN